MPDNNGGANTGASGEGAQGNEPKTFTQEQLDSIVEARVKREREKFSDYEDLKAKAQKYDEQADSRTELEKVTEQVSSLKAELDAKNKAEEIRTVREKVAKEKNVPANLLTAETEEACAQQADEILAFARPTGDYPTVKDQGEAANQGGKASTGKQFAEWAKNQL